MKHCDILLLFVAKKWARYVLPKESAEVADACCRRLPEEGGDDVEGRCAVLAFQEEQRTWRHALELEWSIERSRDERKIAGGPARGRQDGN